MSRDRSPLFHSSVGQRRLSSQFFFPLGNTSPTKRGKRERGTRRYGGRTFIAKGLTKKKAGRGGEVERRQNGGGRAAGGRAFLKNRCRCTRASYWGILWHRVRKGEGRPENGKEALPGCRAKSGNREAYTPSVGTRRRPGPRGEGLSPIII